MLLPMRVEEDLILDTKFVVLVLVGPTESRWPRPMSLSHGILRLVHFRGCSFGVWVTCHETSRTEVDTIMNYFSPEVKKVRRYFPKTTPE